MSRRFERLIADLTDQVLQKYDLPVLTGDYLDSEEIADAVAFEASCDGRPDWVQILALVIIGAARDPKYS